MANSPDNVEETEYEMPALFVPPANSRPQQAPIPVAPAPAAPPASRRVVAAVPIDDPIGECLMRFSDELRAGVRPQIEDYLNEVTPPVREPLFVALLRAELTAQLDEGEPLFIFRRQFLERFPKQKQIVERLFAEFEASETTDVRNEHTAEPFETAPDSEPHTVGHSSSPIKGSLGRFQVIRELGAGANGRVFLARDPKLGREVAIKIPHPERLRTPQDIERFLRATRAAAQLRHENLCPIYEVNDVPGQYFLVMAHIKGKPLSHFLNEHKRLPIRQAVLITKLIATAMIEPHQKGIVHRDLKPDNIQIDEDRHQPVIMDFGLAHFDLPDEPQLTQDGQLLGTPYYMSPEQAIGHSPEIGPLTDLYALGVMMYEMLTGQRPITGRTVGEVLKNVHTQQPIPPSQHRPQIDQTLSDLCLKAIAKSPADRFASMADFAKALASNLKL
ncbi:MAG: serine/threonine protein kinase [Planctomycetaceae bacterium]|nr:serine/threonine protein kinase [Planctomycetaceae bacterium]